MLAAAATTPVATALTAARQSDNHGGKAQHPGGKILVEAASTLTPNSKSQTAEGLGMEECLGAILTLRVAVSRCFAL